MNRLDKTFAALKSQGRKALTSYIMAGDPTPDASLKILEELAKSVDILEIGMPFSDPMADGPTVQAAGLRALAQGMSLCATFELVQKFRSKNPETPIVLMGYLNPILKYGVEKFINDCNDFEIDGLIVADLPPEEDDGIFEKAQQKNIHLIRLLAPTTTPERLAKILPTAGGFLYYVSITGVTGTATADPQAVGKHIAQIKQSTDLPVLAGFGIKTPEDAAAIGAISDGVIVGSALIETINADSDDHAMPAKVGAQAASLAAALNLAKNTV